MDPGHSFSAISLESFNSLLAEYPKVVAPKLTDLDKARYETIPAALADRKATWKASSSGSVVPPAMKKPELVTLVEWKLSHGTFRPSLKQLVESNSEGDVSICTVAGFVSFNVAMHRNITSSLKSLSELKGVGPATASLLLSVWDPEHAPFFSDELYRWSQYEAKPLKGFDRIIKYNIKEYLDLFVKVSELRERLGVRAVDAERVAYVIGWRASGKSAEGTAAVEKSTAQTSKGKRKAEAGEYEKPETKKPAAKATMSSTKGTSKKPAKAKAEPTRRTRSSARLKHASDEG